MISSLRQRFSSNKAIERDISKLESKLNETEALFRDVNNSLNDGSLNPVHTSEVLERALTQLFKIQRKIKKKRGINQKSPHFQRIKEVKWKACSMQLGGEIDVETLLLPENRNFRRFVKSNKVHQISINRGIKLPKVDGEPGVILNGRAVAFSRLNEEAGRAIINENNRFEGACMTKEGIIDHWPYRPSEFRPLEINCSACSPDQYEIEVVTAMSKKNDKTSSVGHSFLRIYTPAGEVFSFGLCGDLDFNNIFSFLSLKNSGCLDNYDRFEDVSRLRLDLKGTKLACTQEQAQRAFDIIREVSTNNLIPFNLANNNCTSLVDRILKEALEIDIPLETPARTYLANLLFSQKMIENYRKKTPRWIKSCIRAVLNLFINLGAIASGINRTDEACAHLSTQKKVKFNTRDLLVKDPYQLRRWQIEVDLQRLQSQEESAEQGVEPIDVTDANESQNIPADT